MSSTNKTSKIQLNQWVASDPVLREDFNSDNLKIDTAFQGVDSRFSSIDSSISALGASVLAIPYEKISKHNFSGNVQQVDINLGVDIWNYSRIFVTVSITAATNDFNAGEVLLNGMTGVYGQPRENSASNTLSEWLIHIGFGGASTQSAISTITLHVMRDSPVSKRVILATREVAVHSHTGYHTYRKEESTGIYETNSTAPINTINFRAYNGSLMSGGRVEVYGVKR